MKQDSLCGEKYFQVELPTEDLIREYESGTSSVELAKKHGCSDGTIIRRLKAAGVKLRTPSESTRLFGEKNGYSFESNIPNNTGSKRSEETKQKMRESNKQRKREVKDEDIIRMYGEGKSSPQIANLVGLTHPAVLRRLRINGIERRPVGVYKGSRRPRGTRAA